ncbi:hypothetical protein [Legionella rowbothamii]|uniref:hypothetical protein n=1 Tax=Legionella rowbothamii TaxID=96229 RepID=UPI0010560713|nr:hypothetical protein [Legionella rowbothamii]
MKVSTYGMWEKFRIQFVTSLLTIPGLDCTREQIDEALLGPVITDVVDLAFKCHEELAKANSPLSMKERIIFSYEKSLACILPTLAGALSKSSELIAPHYECFKNNCLAFSKDNIDYLERLGEISRKIKSQYMIELYGSEFATSYPNLAKLLPFNDMALVDTASKVVSAEIKKECPEAIHLQMELHISYITEISNQRMVKESFAEDFKRETGLSMDDFKKQHALDKKEPVVSVTAGGFFKVGSHDAKGAEQLGSSFSPS